MSIKTTEPNYAGVPLPEVKISYERLLMADSTEKVINRLVGISKIRQINLKGESIPATVNSGPNRGIENYHTERKTIKFGDSEVELRHLVGDIYLELAVEDEKELEAKVEEIDGAVKGAVPIPYIIEVGRYTKFKPTLHDYK